MELLENGKKISFPLIAENSHDDANIQQKPASKAKRGDFTMAAAPKSAQTVEMSTTIWSGRLNTYTDKLNISLSVINGDVSEVRFPKKLNVIGRIDPEKLSEYKIESTNGVAVLKGLPASKADEDTFNKFVEDLRSRNRLVVVEKQCKLIKGFYIVPMMTGQPLLMEGAHINVDNDEKNLLIGILIKATRIANGEKWWDDFHAQNNCLKQIHIKSIEKNTLRGWGLMYIAPGPSRVTDKSWVT